ncbi:MAG TPA: UPF0280 family protein [Verrucomicrobiae bacterium]|nr:UPF0280 family protein [Verrucomicrobiae bacterium]
MNPRAQIRTLSDGRRLHLHDGPIDLIVEAFGSPGEIAAAHHAASERFVTVLDELCSELRFLRTQCSAESPWPRGSVARRMFAATLPYAGRHFITPMAAVAGAVAEEILGSMISASRLSRAYVNDGGDIALHLAPGEQFVVGMVQRPDRFSLFGTMTLPADHPVRGIATSGWRGRSFSLGIADAVTVLADRAAAADAAATIIANAVALPGHPSIVRVPACELAPDTDLGHRRVTQAVGELTPSEIDQALAGGMRMAEILRRMGLIRSAALHLRGQTCIVGTASESSQIQPYATERGLVHA